jgi:protein-disulfide isomerase
VERRLEVRRSWILGVVGAAVIAVAGYAALAPDATRVADTPAAMATAPASDPVTATAETTPAATAEPTTAEAGPAPEAAQPIVLADATVPVELYADDRILGKADAPITMIEYASLTCPHCAAFQEQVVPALKTEYIDQGLVRLVYRDYPLDFPALQAAQLARCAKDDTKFFGLIDTLFKLQHDWGLSKDVPGALAKIGALAGMDKATVDKCLADDALKNTILERRQEAETKYGINSTPTFIVNGQILKGVHTIESLRETFRDMLPKG